MKYRFAKDIASELVDSFTLQNLMSIDKNAILVPIPLHRKRQNWRGFNQAEILGSYICKRFNWQFEPKLLIRKVDNLQQARLSKFERMRNTRGIFAVNDSFKKRILENNHSVIIFDDVCTTGSTLNEAAKVLKKVGVKEVVGMAIAR